MTSKLRRDASPREFEPLLRRWHLKPLQTMPVLRATLMVMILMVVGLPTGAIAQTNDAPANDVPANDAPVNDAPVNQRPSGTTAGHERVLLGQPCDYPYVVAIPTADPEILVAVQAYVPLAFLTDAANGRYIQAGSALNRADLSALSRQLRELGFDARVAYRPVRCPSP